MALPIRVPRPVDRDKFIPIDFEIPRSHRYTDADGVTRPYKHVRAITARSIGKSYTELATRVEKAIRGHVDNDPTRTFMYVRRGADELDLAFPTILKQVSLEFPEFEFRQRGETWEVRPWDSPASAWRTVCYGVALSVVYKRRSNDFTDVEHIVFDEFVDNGGPLHIENEAAQWESFYDSVDRHRGIHTTFLANPQFLGEGSTNPYLIADRVPVKAEMPEFVRRPEKSTLWWFPPAGKFGWQTPTTRMRETSGTEYAAMATGGENVNAQRVQVGKRGPKAVPLCAIKSNGTWYAAWTQPGDYLYLERGAPKTDIPRYCLSKRDIEFGVLYAGYSEPILQYIRGEWKRGAIMFRDVSVSDELSSILVR